MPEAHVDAGLLLYVNRKRKLEGNDNLNDY